MEEGEAEEDDKDERDWEGEELVDDFPLKERVFGSRSLRTGAQVERGEGRVEWTAMVRFWMGRGGD